MKKLLKWLVLIFSWITVSPLILYLGKKWQIGKKKARVALMLLSPLFLFFYSFLLSAFIYWGDVTYRLHFYNNRVRIERITGASTPACRVISSEISLKVLKKDYEETFTFKLKNAPSDSSLNKIDRMLDE